MKKLAVLAAVVVLAAFAAPAFSATNPFMDVPMNHWAYDAIGQLAAHGIISGYPDGMFNGTKSSTRYEMASTIARALAVVDMTKASKQDVEMMKRLVVEFRDELEALGVRVDELDERVAVLEDRLGGWHISGTLALQITHDTENEAAGNRTGDGKTKFDYDEAKLIFERRWGENDEYYFQGRLRADNGVDTEDAEVVTADRFFVEMPFFFDSKLTVGRFGWDEEGAYKIDLPNTGSWMGDQPITDYRWDGFGFTKNFALGTFKAVLAHPNKIMRAVEWSHYMLRLSANLQFTEQIGVDLGGELYMGDNAENWGDDGQANNGDTAFDRAWVAYFGAHYNFNDNVAFKGIFYHQDWSTQLAANNRWQDAGYGFNDDKGEAVEDANHWAVIVDVKQPALKYTSLWLEYGQYDQGFQTRAGGTIMYGPAGASSYQDDIKYYRIGLGQEWNEKWATHIFYYGYDFDQADNAPKEMGLGVQYNLNDSTTMGLNYLHYDPDAKDADDDNVIRFRTLVTF